LRVPRGSALDEARIEQHLDVLAETVDWARGSDFGYVGAAALAVLLLGRQACA
jgi:hypothetical protein